MHPTHEPDVWQLANMLIDHFGDEAPAHAAMKTKEAFASGDGEDALVWAKIYEAVIEMLRGVPAEGELRH